jgi:hypothetical protein
MIAALVLFGLSIPSDALREDTVRKAVRRAVPQLLAGATGHIEKKSCFACHNQAYPAMALVAAKEHGISLPDDFFTGQADHIVQFFGGHIRDFQAGKGTGGQAATAAYALLTLELAGHKPDETTAAMAKYLVGFQPSHDYWRMTSHRPPTESSHFTTTYVAMRALRTYGSPDDRDRIAKRVKAAREWLIRTPGKETEDRVFRLLGLKEAGASEAEIAAAAWDLAKRQRADGGWSQLDSGASDAYATGSALVALHEVGGLKAESAAYRAGVDYLLKTQLPDGSWKVKSRSIPFQPYYESGFPHGKNQFISISASGWATAALVHAMK